MPSSPGRGSTLAASNKNSRPNEDNPNSGSYAPRSRSSRFTADKQGNQEKNFGHAGLDEALLQPKRNLPGQVMAENESMRQIEKTISARGVGKVGTTPRGSKHPVAPLRVAMSPQGAYPHPPLASLHNGSPSASSTHPAVHTDVSPLSRRPPAVRAESNLVEIPVDMSALPTNTSRSRARGHSPNHTNRGDSPGIGGRLSRGLSAVGEWITGTASGNGANSRLTGVAREQNVNNEVKSAIEVLLEAKVTQFRSALKRFRADMWSLAAYFIFTALFTVSILGKGDTKQIFYVRKAVQNTLIDVGGYPGPVAMGPSEVGSVDDIYTYLEQVVVPNVALANMTLIDSACDAEGKDLNIKCDPRVKGECCSTKQPNPSAFVTGGNMMVTSLSIRQLRVLQEDVQIYTGEYQKAFAMPWTPVMNQGKDGAGTTKQWDTRGEEYDWGEDRDFYKFDMCTPSLLNKCLVSDERSLYPGLYTKSGFVTLLKGFDTQMLAQIKDLKAQGFLDGRSTRAVFIDFTAYITSRRTFVIVSILFEVIDLGQVIPSHTIFVTDLHQATPFVWDILEYSVFGYAMLLMLWDMYTMYKLGFEYWNSGWVVYLSWINYALFITSLALEIILNIRYDEIKGCPPLSDKADAFPWLEVAFQEETVYFIMSFNALLAWLRVLAHLEAISPKTRQLTQTIAKSGADLASLSVLILVVLTAFSIGFHLAFGKNVESHNDIVASLSTLLQAILGQFDYDELKRVSKIMAPLFFVSYIAIVMFLMLNMFMAVVMKTYDKVQDHLEHTASRQVTGTGLLKRQINLMVRLIRAGEMQDITGDQDSFLARDSRKQSMIGLGKVNWDAKEELTAHDLEELFKNDQDILTRLSVKTYKELIRLADTEGRHFLPFEEVKDILQSERKRTESQLSQHEQLLEAVAGFGIDPAQLQLLVDNVVQREMKKQQIELESFMQAEMTNLGLVMAGLQQKDSADGSQPPPPTEKKPWTVSKSEPEGGGTSDPLSQDDKRDRHVGFSPAAVGWN